MKQFGRGMYDLANFTLTDMTRCGSALRRMGQGASSMEEAAGRIVRHLHENLVDREAGRRSCALVRFFKTHAYDQLDHGLRSFADRMLGAQPESGAMKCLTLLASSGALPQWNDRRASIGHRAIPLPSAQAVGSIPMISQLIEQLGLEISAVVKPRAGLLVDDEQRTYNVFYVADAAGSPYIPAQSEFVEEHGICSVLGFGGVLPLGDLFVVIVFSTESIPRETTDLFKPLALCTKTAVLPFVGGRVFEHDAADERVARGARDREVPTRSAATRASTRDG